jgi:hypothetical protein
MVSEAGTVRLAELEFSPTVAPPDPPRTTVQVLEAFGARVDGLHAKELNTEEALTEPPVPATAIASPAGEAPSPLLTLIGASAAPDRVTDTVATIPSGIAVEFIPHATQV